jgi:hypothetical protein
MVTVERVDWGYYRIAGYADGSDWLMTPGRDTIHAHGVAASDRVWFYDDRAELHIFDAPRRCLLATLAIGSPAQHGRDTHISVSRDGQRLYALESQSTQQILHVIDPSLGAIVASYDGFPHEWRYAALERADGKLLIPVFRYDDPPAHGLVLFDPTSGEREESWTADHSDRSAFPYHSPDGRWWIKPDRTVLPVLDVDPGLGGRVFGRKPERYYDTASGHRTKVCTGVRRSHVRIWRLIRAA